MPDLAHESADPATEDDNRRARERSAVDAARKSLRDGRVLSGTDAETWLDAWERGEEPAIPEFHLTSDDL